MLQLFSITGTIAKSECAKSADAAIKEAESRFIR